MKKIKLLLYCTKSKPYLAKVWKYQYELMSFKEIVEQDALNGKIVAECDFEVEEIKWNTIDWVDNFLTTKSMSEKELQTRSCVNGRDLREYFGICYDSIIDSVVGYAIHIKNLNIFVKPRELFNYSGKIKQNVIHCIEKAPQNMMYCYGNNTGEKYVLISIRPKWISKILNGEKTIEVRKKILKEMINNA